MTPLNEEAKAKVTEFARELKALMDTLDIRFWEGGIVRVAPTGAPPEFCTVEIEGVWDENVKWSGVPGGLVAGDEVLVWENPVTHRREIIAGSGGTATSPFVHDHRNNTQGGDALNPATLTPQTFVVGPAPAPYQTLGAAVGAVVAFGPGAANPCVVLVQAIVTAEAGDVTVPQYCHVEGQDEGSTIGMGANTLIMSSDSSLADLVVTSSDPVDAIRVNNVSNVALRNVRCIQGAAADCFHILGLSSSVELINCFADTYAGGVGFHIAGTGHDIKLYVCHAIPISPYNAATYGFQISGTVTVSLDYCGAANGHTYSFADGLHMDNTACTCRTRWCTFWATDDDVNIGAAASWSHLACYFDPDNSTVAGTHAAAPTKRFNQALVVAEEGGDFQMLSEAVAWINAQGDAATGKRYGVLILTGNFAEAGAVTIPQWVTVAGMGEGSRIEMAANTLTMSDDSYLQDVVVTHSGTTAIDCANADAQLFNVKVIVSNEPSVGVDITGDSAAKLYHVTVEFTVTGTCVGFNVSNTATPLLWDCEATINTSEGLQLTASACTCTTHNCRFAGTNADVLTGATSTWVYCNDDFDYRNCTIGGTAQPADGQPVIWFDYTVTAANAAAITAAINWVKGRTRVGDFTIAVAAGSHDVGLTFIDIPDEGGGNVILQGDTRVLAALSYVSGPQTAAAWAAVTPYVAGNIVQPTAPNNFYYKCRVAGNSGAAEPAWPVTLNGTVVDGTVTWICCGVPNNRAGLANGGVQDGVCMIASAALTLTVTMTTQVTGVVSNPDFQADGWQNGDTLIAMDNAGAVAVHTITGVAANVITIGAGAPAMGNLGTAFTLLPNRAIARTVAGPCVTNYVSGVKLDGIYLDTATGADCHGVDAQYGSIELENVAIRAEDDGIRLHHDAFVKGDGGALSLVDCYEGVYTNYGGVGAWLNYAIAYDIGHYGFFAVRGYISVDYGIVSAAATAAYGGSGSEAMNASYAYALDCAYGFFAQFVGSVFAGGAVAEGCTTAGFAALYHGGMNVSGSAARNCNIGYWGYYNSYIFAGGTSGYTAGNTTNYSPSPSDTVGNIEAVITYT